MNRSIFGESVQGASHQIVQMECQDSFKYSQPDDETVILAVADGHGSKSSPFSKSGSTIAVNVFCDVMSEFYKAYKDNLDQLITFLNREGEIKIGQVIDAEWNKRVLRAHSRKKRDVPLTADGKKEKESIYRLYGTTIVGMLITSLFVFTFRVGDGEITYVDNGGVENLLLQERILGTDTHSLGKIDSWKSAISEIYRKDVSDHLPSMFMLSTDGFNNSHINDEEFNNSCLGYFGMIKQHGPQAVQDNLKNWLSETSHQGCGDDITLLIVFFDEEEVDDFDSENPFDFSAG